MDAWKLLGTGLIVGTLGLQVGCVGALSQATFERDVQQSVAMEFNTPPSLQVKTHNGKVVCTQTDRSDLLIRAHIRATSQTRLDAVKIVVDKTDDHIAIHPYWPVKRQGSEGVSFEIEAPMAGSVQADTSNGSVTITGFEGDVVVETSNGAVRVSEHQGPINVETSNGAVHVVDATDAVHVDTSNGKIGVSLSDETDGPVHLDTSNGSVHLEVGSGFDGVINADTSNGKVKVVENSSPSRLTMLKESKTHKTIQLGHLNSTAQASIVYTSNGSITIVIK